MLQTALAGLILKKTFFNKINPINIACSCDVLVEGRGCNKREIISSSCKHFNIQIIQYILYRQEK